MLSSSEGCFCWLSHFTFVVGVREAKLRDHDVGVGQGHAAVDGRELVEAVRPLQKVLGSVPHPRVAPGGLFLQTAHVHRFHKYPRSLASVLGNEEVHGNVVAVLRLVDQGADGRGLPLEEVQVLAAEEGGSDQHHGVLVTVPKAWGLQFKASITVDA